MKACNDFKAAVKCGALSAESIQCEAYRSTPCNIAAYFTCLKGAYVCVNGSYDPAKLATASSCAAKATCS